MAGDGCGVRLRQAVIAAADLDAVCARLERDLGLADAFHDPGVGQFGLANSVYAIGDCFIEVVAPVRSGTAAGRQLERQGGDGGYMLLFALADLPAARERARKLGIRAVWEIELPDIAATHLHPADMRGTIVSIDGPQPLGSWRWGGPPWTGVAASPAPGGLLGATLAVADPRATAARWGEVLGVTLLERDAPALALDGGEVRFRTAADGEPEGLVEIAVEPPPAARVRELAFGTVRVAAGATAPA